MPLLRKINFIRKSASYLSHFGCTEEAFLDIKAYKKLPKFGINPCGNVPQIRKQHVDFCQV